MYINIKQEKAIINKAITALSVTDSLPKVEKALVTILESVEFLKGYVVNVEDKLTALLKVMRSDSKGELLHANPDLNYLYSHAVAYMSCL